MDEPHAYLLSDDEGFPPAETGDKATGSSGPIYTSTQFSYDVFLSFRGRDIRHGFAGFLYTSLRNAGFSVSWNEAIFQTEDIHRWRIKAIKRSRIIIPIFSRYYASSTYCLHEVAMISECRRMMGQIVVPIFFDIEPSSVQWQRGTYKMLFHTHQAKGVVPHILDKWRKALQEIGSLRGHTVYERYQVKVVDEIVSNIRNLLMMEENNRKKDNVQKSGLLNYEVAVPEYLVGIDKRVNAVLEELQIFPSRTQILGIWGVPGIGKTTLAKVVYNKIFRHFQAYGFVSDIRRRAAANELFFVQKQLISQLTRKNFDWLNSFSFEDNINFIRNGFWNMRVLIVLDDADCLDHIKAFAVDLSNFGPGSRIVLTTQKPELINELPKDARKYRVEALDEDQAFQLFCQHAFRRDFPDREFYDLSIEIASLIGGIPSLIESIGSDLYHKSRDRWEEVLKVLTKCEQPAALDTEYFLTGESKINAHYDVVLSFDSRDKVINLMESLLNTMKSFGIGTLALDGDLTQANDTGKIFIPVFSKSFGSKALCLKALEYMEECWRSSDNSHILPIFFAVEPFDVSLETPLYREILSKLHTSFDDKLVNHWKVALIEVTNISGWFVAENLTTEETQDLTNSVCQMVLHKLKLNQLSTGNHLVGMNHHMGRILDLLNLEVNDVRMIVFSGEDGAGKTTLAKFLYHQLSSSFEGCSFLTEIDQRTHHHDDIKRLQTKLISDLLNREFDILESVIEGINLIKERFWHMKVLIILDDVGESSHVEALVGQLNWFGPGSRVIITTKFPASISLPHLNYEIPHNWGSAFDKAYELFNKHTFRNYDPPSNFELLSMGIVRQLYGSHSPFLTMELLGSLLYGKGEGEWRSVWQNLQDTGMDLKGILRMSYGRLSKVQKQIFLDISCFPNGMNIRIASFLWYNTLHSQVLDDIEVLVLLSLVKVDANNEIWMHRLVRDFGREIIEQGSLQTRGRGENEYVPLELPTSVFERMDKIRFFKLDHAPIGGSIDVVSMRHRDLIWQWCPLNLLAALHAESLKILDVSQSKLTEDWEGWHQIKVPQLRVLNLSGCSELMVTPVFSFCPDLEMLILEHCSRLVKIDPSIGKLRRLTTLNLRYCLELSILPKEVGCLTALRELPLDGTSLREIPVSIGHLENLTFLTLTNCFSLSHLPSSACDLRSVTVVKLDCTKITDLPYFIGKQMKLRHLSLRDCRGLRRLPSLVGEVESSLIELDVSKTSISELPKSIINLKALKVLKMDFCFITGFPPCFGNLKKLEEIHATWCRNLEHLPYDVGRLESLRILKVGHSCISFVPRSIQALACIETVDCTSCNNLQNLPQLPSSLTSLHVESKELKKPPNLVPLKRLKEFSLASGNGLKTMISPDKAEEDGSFYWPELSILKTLRLCLPQIRNLPGFPQSLRTLKLHCGKLEHIPPLPLTLVVLSIQDCVSLREMPSVESLKDLQEMEILRCPEFQKIDGLEKLQALRVLTMSCSKIESLDGLDKLKSLVRLALLNCNSLSELPSVENLKNLQEMEILQCPELKKIDGLEKLQALQVLTMSSSGIESLDGLDKLTSLVRLTLFNCSSLSELPDLSVLKNVVVTLL